MLFELSHKCYRMILKGNNCCAYIIYARYYDLLIMVMPKNECLIGQYTIFMLHIFFFLLLLVAPYFLICFYLKKFPGKNQLLFRAELQKIKINQQHSAQRRTVFYIDSWMNEIHW